MFIQIISSFSIPDFGLFYKLFKNFWILTCKHKQLVCDFCHSLTLFEKFQMLNSTRMIAHYDTELMTPMETQTLRMTPLMKKLLRMTLTIVWLVLFQKIILKIWWSIIQIKQKKSAKKEKGQRFLIMPLEKVSYLQDGAEKKILTPVFLNLNA